MIALCVIDVDGSIVRYNEANRKAEVEFLNVLGKWLFEKIAERLN
jgi:hypothetical protein